MSYCLSFFHKRQQSLIGLSFDLAVNLQIDRHEKAVGFSLEDDFDLVRFVGVQEQADLFADQPGRRLKDSAFNGDGAVLVTLLRTSLRK
jgi:hypothetical protein